MKNSKGFLICPFVLAGICLLLAINCKKDDNNNFKPLNIATVLIPAGTFTMGSPATEFDFFNDETQHQVTLSAFRMSKFEITNSQYAAFLNAKNMDSTGRYTAGNYSDQTLIFASKSRNDWGLHYTNGQWVPVTGYENHPVINVTWYGADEFAINAGACLPTEAQWEYACRGTTATSFNTGSCLTNIQANYNWSYPYNSCSNNVTTYSGTTNPVGTYSANDYGLNDMHGNVWEWCSDKYGPYATNAQTNPSGAAEGMARVFRGGSWNAEARFCRSAYRGNYYPNNFTYFIGFRIAFVL